MKAVRLAVLVLFTGLSFTAGAQQWRPVTSGSQSISQPSGGITFTPVGPTTFGSDGSYGIQSGGTTRYSDGSSSYQAGGVRVHSDGTRVHTVGDTTFIQRPDGARFACRGVAGDAVCTPQ